MIWCLRTFIVTCSCGCLIGTCRQCVSSLCHRPAFVQVEHGVLVWSCYMHTTIAPVCALRRQPCPLNFWLDSGPRVVKFVFPCPPTEGLRENAEAPPSSDAAFLAEAPSFGTQSLAFMPLACLRLLCLCVYVTLFVYIASQCIIVSACPHSWQSV